MLNDTLLNSTEKAFASTWKKSLCNVNRRRHDSVYSRVPTFVNLGVRYVDFPVSPTPLTSFRTLVTFFDKSGWEHVVCKPSLPHTSAVVLPTLSSVCVFHYVRFTLISGDPPSIPSCSLCSQNRLALNVIKNKLSCFLNALKLFYYISSRNQAGALHWEYIPMFVMVLSVPDRHEHGDSTALSSVTN
jgi:hypothetical protein